jgi:AraC-like DNA-binding protein
LPYRIDFFAVFIFLGIIQAIFLLFFFFSAENRKTQANVFHGLFLIAIVCCIFEIFMMYTGYIVNAFYLVDFSESLGLAIGPLFYLMVISLVRGSVTRAQYLHLIPFVLYSFALVLFLALPVEAKYNAWVNSYRPDLPYKDFTYPYDVSAFGIRDHITEITLFSILVYSLLCLQKTIQAFRFKKESFWKAKTPVLKTLRTGIISIITVLIIILIVKFTNKEDTGDHIFATYISLTIYFTSFSVMRNSDFFKQTSLLEQQKYKSSSVSPEIREATLNKLKLIMENDKPFLKSEFSLPDLADRTGVSVHALSQIVNEGLGKNFFEMVAEYRINEAKKILKNAPHLKVEEVAEQVGYNSKSSFNTMFKKITGITPSAYRSN